MTDKTNKTETKQSKKGVFLRLSKYVLEQWPLFITALALTLLSNQLSLLGPRYSGAAIDAIELESGVDFGAVFVNVGFMIACYALSAILAYFLKTLYLVGYNLLKFNKNQPDRV